MTELAWWRGTDAWHYSVNGCLRTRVADREAFLSRDDVARMNLAIGRVTPLVWLAMPGHEGNSTVTYGTGQ